MKELQRKMAEACETQINMDRTYKFLPNKFPISSLDKYMFESNAKSKNILQKKFNLTWASELILVG